MVAQTLIPALLVPALLLAVPLAAPARAAVVLDLPTSIGATGTFGFTGSNPDLSATLTLALSGRNAAGTSFLFDYTLSNDSGGIFTSARLAGFGFDVGGSFGGASIGGSFTHAGAGNLPGFGPTEACFSPGGNGNSRACASNPVGGVLIGGADAVGQLTLSFLQAPAEIELSNIYVRWRDQSRRGGVPEAQVTAATYAQWSGLFAEPAPEPATWAMMIAGFGLVGGALRRRRTERRPV